MKKILNSQFSILNSESGQVILILVLVMTVALAIGISVVQRSLTDISTSSKVEQSSRAFSAAEAGIEKVLANPSAGNTTVSFTTENQSSATVTNTNLIPCVPGIGTCAQGAGARQVAMEYPPLVKEDVAHFWLSDYNSLVNPPPAFYKQTSLDVYWGNSSSDRAALELTLVYYDAGSSQYVNRKWYLDHVFIRTPDNKFCQVSTCSGNPVGSSTYQCKFTIGNNSTCANAVTIDNSVLPSNLILLRARLLYNTNSQPLAIQAVNTCGSDCSVPPQARNIDSVGSAGTTQRKVRVFQIEKIVPPYFDYAIFSAGGINK